MVDDFRPQRPNEPTDKPDDFQATYENKPETYVTPSGEPTTLGAAPQPSLEIPKKKKSGAKKALLWGVVVLLLAGTGTLAYWQWAEAQNAKQELNSTQGLLQAAQADLARVNTQTETDTETTGVKTKTDKDLIVESVTAYWHAAKGAENDKLVTTVEKIELPFARTSAGSVNGAGVSCVSKKSDDIWVVLFCAQGDSPETQALMTKYGVPESIIKS